MLPLVRKTPLLDKAQEVFQRVSKKFSTDFDVTGSIGKRYRRQDEIGTPFCFTIDFETLENNTVTVRNRDTMLQERVSVENITKFLERD